MQIEHSFITGCFTLKPTLFTDHRGYFFESYNKEVFNEIAQMQVEFVQDNQSFSTKGVLRGLHFQSGAYQQAKLVRVLMGTVLDVVVDLRKDSVTFGDHFKVILSHENQKQIFIPKGFAHGFVVLSDTALISYKADAYYNPKSESGILYNDPKLEIDWQIADNEIVVSEKDKLLPLLYQINPL